MLTGRAFAVLGGGALLWLASRAVGSGDLHILAVGLLALVPLCAAFVRWMPRDLRVTRRVSAPRAFPGTRIRVDVDLENRSRVPTSFLLLEDRLPAALGSSARTVVGSIMGEDRQRVSYEVVPRERGRYRLGPLSVSVSDPFGLARVRVRFPERHDLIVFPEVEDLERARLAAPAGGAGESATRQLFRTGEEFYTMRAYEVGDDLRKIHWPSVARTGELMIRQDETARRASATVFLDSRRVGLGITRAGFEIGVSAAASIGNLFHRGGLSVRLATADVAPTPLPRDGYLEALALMQPSRSETLTPAIERLRSTVGAASLVAVLSVPGPAEVAALSRSASTFAQRIALLVHPGELDNATLRARTTIEDRVEAARISLSRAGWDVLVMRRGTRLANLWRRRTTATFRRIAASS